MASDFEFRGIENHLCMFVERSSGMGYSLPAPSPEDAPIELLDGDEVVVPTAGGVQVYSIREQRVIRHHR